MTARRRPAPPAPPRAIADDLVALAHPVDALTPLDRNPRRGDVEAVMRSLTKFGQRKPITARRRPDGVEEITAGNHTWEAARRLGWPSLAVVWEDDDDQTAKAWALADNRTSELGTNDEAALLEFLQEVRGASDAELFAATSYTEADLERLLGRPASIPEGLTDPDDVPAAASEPRSQLGDVWVLEPHRLVCGDARDLETLERAMGGSEADMVWTDPPYGVSYVGGTKDALTIVNDDLSEADLDLLLRAALGNAYALCHPGATWYVASPSGPLGAMFARVLTDLGVYRQGLVWVKDQFVLGRSDFHGRHEELLYGWVEGDHRAPPPLADFEDAHGSLLYGWKPEGPHRAPPDRRQDSVWNVPRPRANRDHPTQKPVALIERSLWNSSEPGAHVLDPFGGSGSTLLACHRFGRVAHLVELDRRYADVICRRWQDHTGELPVSEASGEAVDFDAEER